MIGGNIATEVALILNVGLFVLFAESDAIRVVLIFTEETALGTFHVPRILIHV